MLEIACKALTNVESMLCQTLHYQPYTKGWRVQCSDKCGKPVMSNITLPATKVQSFDWPK